MDNERVRKEEDAVAREQTQTQALERQFAPGDNVFVTRQHDGNTGLTGMVIPRQEGWGPDDLAVYVQIDGGSWYRYRPEDLLPVREVTDLQLYELSIGTDSVFPDARLSSVAHSDNVPQMDTKPEPTHEMPVVDTSKREIARDVAVLFLDRHGKKRQAIQLAEGHSRCDLMDGDDVIATVLAKPGYEGRIPWAVQIPQSAAIQLTPSDEGLAAVLMEPEETIPESIIDQVVELAGTSTDPAELLKAAEALREHDEATHGLLRSVPATTEERINRYLPPPPVQPLRWDPLRWDIGDRASALRRAETVLADARRAVVQLEQLIAELTLEQ